MNSLYLILFLWLLQHSSGFFRNRWENAISTADNYAFGETGFCSNGGCGSSNQSDYTISYPAGADWYMKIGLEQN